MSENQKKAIAASILAGLKSSQPIAVAKAQGDGREANGCVTPLFCGEPAGCRILP